jgi:transcriptional regulator with XRE-family HTH domain
VDNDRKLIFDEFAVKAFATILRKVRKEKGLTQNQLSFESNVPRSSIERMEAGKINPTLSTIVALAKGLDVRPSILLDFDLPLDLD